MLLMSSVCFKTHVVEPVSTPSLLWAKKKQPPFEKLNNKNIVKLEQTPVTQFYHDGENSIFIIIITRTWVSWKGKVRFLEEKKNPKW